MCQGYYPDRKVGKLGTDIVNACLLEPYCSISLLRSGISVQLGRWVFFLFCFVSFFSFIFEVWNKVQDHAYESLGQAR